jgi:hypothetical protein
MHVPIIAAIAPMLLWDLYRTRTLHKANVIWFSLFIAAGVVVHLLWNTAWWRRNSSAFSAQRQQRNTNTGISGLAPGMAIVRA